MLWNNRDQRDNPFELTQPIILNDFINQSSDEEDFEEDEEEDRIWKLFLEQHVVDSLQTLTNIRERQDDTFVYSEAANPFAEDWEEFLDRLPNGPFIFQNTNIFNNIQYTYPLNDFDDEADDDSKYHFVRLHSGYIVQWENTVSLTNDVFDLNTFWHNTIGHTMPYIFIRFVLFHRFMRLVPLDNEADTAKLTRDVIDLTMFWKSSTEPKLELPLRSFQPEEIFEDNLQDALERYPLIFT